MNENRERAAGFARIFERYGLDTDLLWRRSFIRADTRPRETHTEGGCLVETFPHKYLRGEEDFDDLVFALKYDGVNPYALVKVFSVVDREALARRIAAQPTSQYARRLAFFCERLAGFELDLEDASQGAWVNAVDPREQFCSEGQRLRRYRVIDNLLGGAGFCPMVRRTPELEGWSQRDLQARTAEVTAQIEPALLKRITRYLYTKETKSSFEIEREQPGNRIERYLDQLASVEGLELHTRPGLVELQNSLVDPRYADADVRGPGEDEVYIGETIGWRERVHHIGAPSADTPALVDAWLGTRALVGRGSAVVEAAVRAFAFVFIHPFSDGNGRLHRLLIHYVLARRAFAPPGIIIPISAVLLDDPMSYEAALEDFSRKVMKRAKYTLDREGRLSVEELDVDLYRFPDLTVQATATFAWLERAIEENLLHEAEFLRRYDETVDRMRDLVEMPDRKEHLFIELCRTNGGKLSKRKRGHFAELDDELVAALEAVVRESMVIES